MKRKSDIYLSDILIAIQRIKEYTAGKTFESFQNSKMASDAVLRNLEVIGEIAAQLPEEVQYIYQSIPWNKIKAFRNVAIHRYWEINLTLVWDIVTTKLDWLEQQIQEILSKNKE